jgi:tetratricopeptide (TPR) repeat protein
LKLLSPEARILSAYAAAVGEWFTVKDLEEIIGWNKEKVNSALNEMLQKRIIKPTAGGYDFIHDLFREGTYEGFEKGKYKEITRVDLPSLHKKIAQALEHSHKSDLGTISSRLAIHYELAEEPEQAIRYYLETSKSAKRLSAYRNVIDSADRGLKLLNLLPDISKRDQQELALQVEKMFAVVSLQGYAVPEVLQICRRAQELCIQLGQMEPLFPVLWGLAMYHLVRAELASAVKFIQQCLGLAEQMQDSGLLVESRALLGVIRYYQGEFAEAIAQFDNVYTLYNDQQYHTLGYVQDPKVICLSFWGLTLWFQGSPLQALKKLDEALKHAESINHQYSKALALFSKTWFYLLCRDWHAAYKQSEELIEISRDHNFSFWLVLGLMFHDRATFGKRENVKTASQLHQYTKSYQETGARLALDFWLSMLAEILQEGGDIDEGLNKLNEAFSLKERESPNEGSFYDAELYRLKGDLILNQSQKSQGLAEELLSKACRIANKQGAKSLELRAELSLCRLWKEQGKKVEAFERLQKIYDSLPKDFETTDLRLAAMLLDELSK